GEESVAHAREPPGGARRDVVEGRQVRMEGVAVQGRVDRARLQAALGEEEGETDRDREPRPAPLAPGDGGYGGGRAGGGGPREGEGAAGIRGWKAGRGHARAQEEEEAGEGEGRPSRGEDEDPAPPLLPQALGPERGEARQGERGEEDQPVVRRDVVEGE